MDASFIRRIVSTISQFDTFFGAAPSAIASSKISASFLEFSECQYHNPEYRTLPCNGCASRHAAPAGGCEISSIHSSLNHNRNQIRIREVNGNPVHPLSNALHKEIFLCIIPSSCLLDDLLTGFKSDRSDAPSRSRWLSQSP